MTAPRGPPIQFHHGAARIVAADGAAGRISNITTTAVIIVPQIEKNVAQRASFRYVRKEAFAAAWTEMHAPANIAETNAIQYMLAS